MYCKKYKDWIKLQNICLKAGEYRINLDNLDNDPQYNEAIKLMDEWQISLGYARGSNISVRGYLDLRTWSLRLRA